MPIIGCVSAKGHASPAPAGRDWVEHTTGVLAQAGHRSSAPRRAVVEQLGGQACVRSARDIADALRAEGRDVGLATVYRALELLDDLGLVNRLDTGEGSARYEPADPGGDHHHHIVCDMCGRVTAFEDERLEREIARLAQRVDHHIGAHDVILRGHCSSCASGRR